MGPQSCGKSTLAKIISFCTWMEKTNAFEEKMAWKDAYKRLRSYHKLSGSYFNEDSLIYYAGENLTYVYNWKEKEEIPVLYDEYYTEHYIEKEYFFLSLDKKINPKVIYIPAERNFVSVVPNLRNYAEDNDNLLDFNHFGLIAPNKQRLELLGTVDFASFSAIKMDASVQAKNFQAMKVKENTETMVYGKVFVDLSATLKGMLDNLKVRGNINLLDNSEVYYTLKSSPLELTDRSADVVRFVSFSDTTQLAAADELQQISSVNLDLLMSVNIAPLVGLNVLLSSNGQNRVAINGGGNLTYTLNPVGETRLVGRYVLTSGIVSYGLPVIGQKDFKIQDGSFVEWTGDLANPTLNITAAETISASVTDDSQKSRLVTFNAMIKISNTLEKLDITFDLAAEGDITIQNQLAAMTAEERSKEAMNMMIYGTYSGPGTVAKSNASDNALNNFVENELNQWSRKHLKNMDLTFGINTYNQVSEAGESKKTDYSYQFSKRLFNNKVRVKVGGRISTDNDPAAGGVEENLVDDIAIEYVFGKNPNFFLKIFRHTGYESVLEGEVTQTGIGVVLRKNFQKFMDIFRRKKKVQVESKIEPIENEKSGK